MRQTFNCPTKPDLRGIKKESVQEYLARGGKIQVAKPITIAKEKVMGEEKEVKSCKECLFCEKQHDGLRCRYFPPLPHFGHATVAPDSWCSRFRKEDHEMHGLSVIEQK